MAIQRERVQAKAGGGQEEHADEGRAGQGPEAESGGDQDGHAELGKGLGRGHRRHEARREAPAHHTRGARLRRARRRRPHSTERDAAVRV